MSDSSSESDLENDSKSEQDFAKAADHVERYFENYSTRDLLSLYALYKQADEGVCNIEKPGLFNLQGRAKWCAWNSLGNMSSDEAKHKYVEKLKSMNPDWCPERQDQEPSGNWVVHSVQLPPAEDSNLSEEDKNSFDHVKEGNLQRLRNTLTQELLQQLDANGLGLVHWATDRNSIDILKFLFEKGANVNLRDSEGQTALHYAASCAHIGCLELLLKYGADKHVRDDNGKTCLDVAEDAEVRRLLEEHT